MTHSCTVNRVFPSRCRITRKYSQKCHKEICKISDSKCRAIKCKWLTHYNHGDKARVWAQACLSTIFRNYDTLNSHVTKHFTALLLVSRVLRMKKNENNFSKLTLRRIFGQILYQILFLAISLFQPKWILKMRVIYIARVRISLMLSKGLP
jgi:hypothetical protein